MSFYMFSNIISNKIWFSWVFMWVWNTLGISFVSFLKYCLKSFENYIVHIINKIRVSYYYKTCNNSHFLCLLLQTAQKISWKYKTICKLIIKWFPISSKPEFCLVNMCFKKGKCLFIIGAIALYLLSIFNTGRHLWTSYLCQAHS